MPKPYKVTKEIRDKLLKEFTKMLDGATMYDGHLEIKKDYVWKSRGKEDRAKLIFTQLAWLKMITVLSHFDTEVGWHCTAERIDDNTYRINDLLFYPQLVTGAKVDTDNDSWNQWIISPEYNEVANQVMCQAHSHVNMSTSPSGQDNQNWSDLLQTVDSDGFYILMIWNKKLDHTINIYNMRENIIFTSADVDVEVEGLDLKAFLEMVDSRVKRRTSNYGSGLVIPGAAAARTGDTRRTGYPTSGGRQASFYDTETGSWHYDG